MRDFFTIYERLEELLLNKFPEYEKDDITAYKKTICYQQIICQMLHEDDFEYWLNFEVPKLTQRKFELLVHVEW